MVFFGFSDKLSWVPVPLQCYCCWAFLSPVASCHSLQWLRQCSKRVKEEANGLLAAKVHTIFLWEEGGEDTDSCLGGSVWLGSQWWGADTLGWEKFALKNQSSARRDRAAGTVLALYMTDPVCLPESQVPPSTLSGVMPDGRARSKLPALPGMT